MSVFDYLSGRHWKPGPGADSPPPKKGFARFRFIFSTHFSKLVKLSILTSLFSLPLVTLPAALCGMNAVLIRLVDEGVTFLWDDFRQGFKAGARHIPLGLLFSALPFLAAAAWIVELKFAPVALVIGIAALILDFYLFPLFTISGKGSLQCFQTALALSVLHWRRTLLLAVPLALVAAMLWLWPWTLLFFAALMWSVSSLAALLALYPVFLSDGRVAL